MEKDYSSLINRIENRYNPDGDRLVEQRTYSSLSSESKSVAKYVKAAMSEVDETYTKRSKEAGERVKTQLQRQQNGVYYEYQGSVMTRTHIRGASDIDLLTLTNEFDDTELSKIRWEVANNPSRYSYIDLCRLKNYDDKFSPYQGSRTQALLKLRLANERILSSVYSQCDISKPKSIKVHLLGFNRDVDVVTASWFDSIEYVLQEEKIYRGINIYNKETGSTKGPDYPFLGIHRINSRSSITNGKLKKMIRFLKNVRADADKKIDLSSFEINAVCYNIPSEEYLNMYYLSLVNLLWYKMYNLLNNQNQLDSLVDVTGHEYVFKNKPDKVEALNMLKDEVWNIREDLNR